MIDLLLDLLAFLLFFLDFGSNLIFAFFDRFGDFLLFLFFFLKRHTFFFVFGDQLLLFGFLNAELLIIPFQFLGFRLDFFALHFAVTRILLHVLRAFVGLQEIF